ncbi:MAG TPA: NUDIX hydrolase [Candidatus Saccharimonadales bacterium]|nr:NUDIX hydrolase [Candidatus Saccharimonadales bacterium]
MKIPKHAKLVFKGKIFDTYQWEQKLYDGSTETFEGLKRPDTIQIIPTTEGKILLSHEEQPNKPLSYTFLGGRAEEGEEPLITAKRELLEEAGVESDDWELIKTYENEGKIEWNIYLFVARNCKKVSEPHLDPGEKIEVKEVSFDEFLEIVSSEKFWGRDIANDILRMRLDSKKLEKFKAKLITKI